MRSGIFVSAALGLLAFSAPAAAQFAAPFAGPGILTTPEVVSGAIGASVAHSAAQPQPQPQCTTTYAGRSGPQSVCAPVSETRPKR